MGGAKPTPHHRLLADERGASADTANTALPLPGHRAALRSPGSSPSKGRWHCRGERKVQIDRTTMAAEGVGDGDMATVEYRIARGGHDEMIAIGAWLAGEEIESSAARRQPLTFEVGSKMVLPVLDHAVRRLALGAETGAACTCAPASDA